MVRIALNTHSKTRLLVYEGYGHCDSFSLYLVPNGSPTVSNIMRLDAGSIFLSWDPLPTVMSNGVVTNYFIRYRSISSEGSARYHRDSSEEEYMVTSTTGLQVTIENLDPRLTYSIGVAASNQAGIGSYSDGTIVGCKYSVNPFFKITDCLTVNFMVNLDSCNTIQQQLLAC